MLLNAVPRPADTVSREQSPSLFEVDSLSRTYTISTGVFSSRSLMAVQDVSLSLGKSETLGIVGESGSGKSTLARCLLRLEEPDAGRIEFNGQDITHLSGSALRSLRSELQIVLQDPYTALDPRHKIGAAIAEGPLIHGVSAASAERRVAELLEMVGLPKGAADRYPHEFSGGQRQRICIARALALNPKVLIADEAVSALDVSVQAQILTLFHNLQQAIGFAMIFITHDIMVAAAICDQVLVMRQGKMVEYGPTATVFQSPQETYTKELIAAVPGGLYTHTIGVARDGPGLRC